MEASSGNAERPVATEKGTRGKSWYPGEIKKASFHSGGT